MKKIIKCMFWLTCMFGAQVHADHLSIGINYMGAIISDESNRSDFTGALKFSIENRFLENLSIEYMMALGLSDEEYIPTYKTTVDSIFGASLKARLPLDRKVDLVASVGLAAVNLTTNDFRGTHEMSSGGLSYSGGIRIAVSSFSSFNADYTVYPTVSDSIHRDTEISAFSVGYSLDF